jgi:hypothetical protein
MCIVTCFYQQTEGKDYSLATMLEESNPKADTRAQLSHTGVFSCKGDFMDLNANANLIYDASDKGKCNLSYLD